MNLEQIPLWMWAGGGLLVLILVVVVLWRLRGERDLTRRPAAPIQTRPDVDDIFAASRPAPPPRAEDLMPDMTRQMGFSAQLQTPSYNIRIEQVGRGHHFVVNGVTYERLEDILDGEMRSRAQELYSKAFQGGPMGNSLNETLRQVMMGNQTTIESKSQDHMISIQGEGKQVRFIVDGLTYYNLKEIPDPEAQRIAKQLLNKRV